jgi:hypothetical protein
VAHAGQFVMPAAIALALPSQLVSVITLQWTAPEISVAASHNWQGRAPPQS